MKRFLIVSLIAVLLSFGVWFFVIPEDLIVDFMEKSVAIGHLQFEVKDLRKGLFFDFRTRNVLVKSDDQEILSVDRLEARMNPLRLFLLRFTILFQGEIGGGRVIGEVNLMRRRDQVQIALEGSHIEEIPILTNMGLKGSGILFGEFRMSDGQGDLKFSIQDARLERRAYSGVSIPLDLFHNGRGAILIEGDRIRIASIAMEGEGIYARIKGNMGREKLELTMELMPGPSFVDEGRIFSALEIFRVSPGYYVLPISAAIGREPKEENREGS